MPRRSQVSAWLLIGFGVVLLVVATTWALYVAAKHRDDVLDVANGMAELRQQLIVGANGANLAGGGL